MARAETRLLLLPFSQSTSQGCKHWSRSTTGVKLRGRSVTVGYPATSLRSDGELRQRSRWTLLPSPRLQGTGVTLLGSPWAMRQPSPPARGARERGDWVPRTAPGTSRSPPSAPRCRCEA